MPQLRGEQVQDETITGTDIKNGTIQGVDIADNAISASKVDIRYKEAVTAVADLPVVNNTIGDVRLVLETKTLYTWDGNIWYILSSGNTVSIVNPVVFHGYSITATANNAYTGYGEGRGCNRIIDTHNAMNTLTGIWVCPVEGQYKITVTRHIDESTTTRDITDLYKNGFLYTEIVETSDPYTDVDGSVSVYLFVNDPIFIRKHSLTKAGSITLYIEKIQTQSIISFSPSSIDLTPSVNRNPMISGQIGSAGILTGPAKIAFDDFWVNTGGITYDTINKRFYVSKSGNYRISMNPLKNSGATPTRVLVGINTDIPTTSTHKGHTYSDSATYDTMSLDSTVSLNAGDYVVFYLSQGSIYNGTTDRLNQFSIQYIEEDKNDIKIYKDCTFNNGGSIVNSYVEYDNVVRNFSTTWSDGKTWATQNYRGNSKLKIDLHIPVRINNAVYWAGYYTELQYSLNGGAWVSLGNSGYDGMNIGVESTITSFNHHFLLDITTPSSCTVAFKTRHKSYNGDLIVNGSHEILGDEFFSKIIIIEIANEPSQVVPANYGAYVRPAMYRYNTADNIANQYIHMKTNQPINNVMFCYNIRGYAYGSAVPINSTVVGYPYQPSNDIVSKGTTGTHACGSYKSSDGYVVLTMYVASTYYLGFIMDQIGAGPQGLWPTTILAATYSANATGVY